MTRRLVQKVLIAAVAALTVGVAVEAPASATPPKQVNYVNLGDSYSSGSGVSPIAPGTELQCWQSSNNFAHIVARKHGYRLTDVSCGGAKTDDFYAAQFKGLKPQLAALNKGVDVVTFSIGGNDGNLFGGTVQNCVTVAPTTGWQGSPCKDRYGRSTIAKVHNQVYPALVKAMRAVRAKAPNARVFALNYPWIAPDRNAVCPGFPIAPGDGKFTHRVQQELNDAIAKAASKSGVTVVDVAAASKGHDACKPEGVRWVEPLLTTVQPVPVHPNALGERKMAGVVSSALMMR